MIYLFAAILGLAIGSFLNVCIYRIPRKGSVMSPRWSFCPHCEHTLGPLDNIPVLSYIFLKGKCRYCKERISPRYMIVELLTTGLFVLMAHKNLATYNETLPLALGIVASCIFAAMLVAISFIDLEFTIIPNKIVYPGLVIGLLFAIGMAVVQRDKWFLISRLLDVHGAMTMILPSGSSPPISTTGIGCPPRDDIRWLISSAPICAFSQASTTMLNPSSEIASPTARISFGYGTMVSISALVVITVKSIDTIATIITANIESTPP